MPVAVRHDSTPPAATELPNQDTRYRAAVRRDRRQKPRRASRGSARSAAGRGRERTRPGEPLAQLRVDLRVVEEREVVGAAELEAVLVAKAEATRAAAARRARREDEHVANEPADR